MAAMKFLAPYALLFFTVLLHSKLFPNLDGDKYYIVPPICRALVDLSSWAIRTGQLLLNGVGNRTAILDAKPKSRLVVLNILLLCGEVDPNPGPQWKYLCGVCSKPVKSNQKGILCDYCDRWYHSKCCLSDLLYDTMANSSCLWMCCDCGLPSFSSSLFDSLRDDEGRNCSPPLNHYSF